MTMDGEDRLVPVSPHGRRVLDLASIIIGNGQEFWRAIHAADLVVSMFEEKEESEAEEDR
jgi:hypothetical protein